MSTPTPSTEGRHFHALSPLEVVPEATEDAQDNEGAERGTPEVPSGAPLDVRLHHLPERLPVERRVLAEQKQHDRRHVQGRRGRVPARRRRRSRVLVDPQSLLLLLLLGRGAVVQRAQERQKEGVRVRPDYGRPQEARVGLRTYVTTTAEVVTDADSGLRAAGEGCVCQPLKPTERRAACNMDTAGLLLWYQFGGAWSLPHQHRRGQKAQ